MIDEIGQFMRFTCGACKKYKCGKDGLMACSDHTLTTKNSKKSRAFCSTCIPYEILGSQEARKIEVTPVMRRDKVCDKGHKLVFHVGSIKFDEGQTFRCQSCFQLRDRM